MINELGKINAMRKICIFGPSKLFLSGLSYYTIRLANALSRENEVSVITFRKLLPKFLFPGRSHVGKDLSELDFSPSVKTCDVNWNSPRSWLLAITFLRKNDPQVLIFQWWTSAVGHLYLLFKVINRLFLHKKIILEVHEIVNQAEESMFPLRVYSKFVTRVISNNSFALTHSEKDKELFGEIYHFPLKKLWVVPLGPFDHYIKLDKDIARKALGIGKEFVILYFGLIRNYKGVEYLIEGFNKIKKEGIQKFRLVIVGEVWDDIHLEEMIASSPYRDRIDLRNEYVPDDDVALYFSAADVVVLPYLRSSQSGVAHIAITYRLPLIVTKVGGLIESMSDYGGTSFIPPGDSDAIKDAILRCYETHIAGRKSIQAPELSWEGIAKRYGEIIDEIQE